MLPRSQSCTENSQNPQNSCEISHSHSINTIASLDPDYFISDDLLAGQRYEGRMSSVRRFFCLFVTFDVLFIGLLWVICVMLNGENLIKALTDQIYHYDVQTSLFDIFLVAAGRFFILMLFYGLLYINHWIIIAISTTLTCVLIIVKVFLYDWPHSPQPVFEVLLVLISFILAWGEAWFLDFKVLPQEFNARRFLVSNVDSERAPLIRRYIRNFPQSMYSGSVNFYSPNVSPGGSIHESDGTVPNNKYAPARLNQDQINNYKKFAQSTLDNGWELIQNEKWKEEKMESGSVVYSIDHLKYGKTFKISVELDISPRSLFDELFYKISSLPNWLTTVLEAEKVQVIDEHTDITYQVAKGNKLITSRDFVTLRHWTKIEDCYVICNSSTEHPNIPKTNKHVRGDQKIGCLVVQPIQGEPDRCRFEFALNTDPKVTSAVPQSFINKALMGSLSEYVRSLKIHISNLKEI